MRFSLPAAFLLAAVAHAQSAPAPDACLETAKNGVVVSFAGKDYRLASEACREQVLSDPERYAQLYDALLELEREGVAPPAPPSLVPS
jgi:YHS domain-containing protein